MKKLSLLFVAIIATLCFTIVSCDKDNTANTITPTIATDAPDPKEDEEIFDDLDDEKEPVELEERAAKIKIDSVVYFRQITHTNGFIYNAPETFCGSKKINGRTPYIPTPEGVRMYKVYGFGFGSNQGTLSVLIKGISVPSTIISWSDSLVTLHLTQDLQFNSGYVTIKFAVTNAANNIRKTKTIKALNAILLNNTPNIWAGVYPLADFEVAKQRNLSGYGYVPRGVPNPIDSTYKPQRGDVLCTSMLTYVADAIIMSIDSTKAGKEKYKIWHRNMDCNGSLKKITYYYNKGIFTSSKTGLPTYISYKR